MPGNELFTKALGLEKPWYVKDVKFDLGQGKFG